MTVVKILQGWRLNPRRTAIKIENKKRFSQKIRTM